MNDSIISRIPLFEGMSPEEQEELRAMMTQTTLRRGETLFNEGDAGDRFYVLLSGKVKLGHASADGRENLLAVLGPGEVVGAGRVDGALQAGFEHVGAQDDLDLVGMGEGGQGGAQVAQPQVAPRAGGVHPHVDAHPHSLRAAPTVLRESPGAFRPRGTLLVRGGGLEPTPS